MRRRDFIKAIAGTAATWPLAVYGQQSARPVVGPLHFGSSGPFEYQVGAFNQGLKETGYVDGQNTAIEYRGAEGQYNRLPALAADLVNRKTDVIAAIGPPCASAAKQATSTIPIVFTIGTDPVVEGLVTGLARPGGNLTGISLLAVELVPKRLELLSEMVPRARMFVGHVNRQEEGSDSCELSGQSADLEVEKQPTSRPRYDAHAFTFCEPE